MPTIARLLGLAVLFSTWSTASALAQSSTAPEPPLRDGLAIGASLAPTLAGDLALWPAARVSLPLGARAGLDVDAGSMFGMASGDNDYFSTRAFFAAQIRFLRKVRDTCGSSRFWIVGPVLITGADLDGHGSVVDPHAVIGAIRLGYGGDRIFANGIRAASEVGVIGGGSSAPTGIYAGLTIQWRPRR